ncbi:MAG: hypothetical protein IJ257_06570 [Treponema sp.]|nr:hypothetical protein [Treponema sp.]
MKRILRFLAMTFALPLVISSVACTNDDDIVEAAGDSALSYNYVTRNRGYIGGSVIYNPGGANNQLESGTKLGIRLGFLTKSYETVTLIEGVDYDTEDKIVIDVDSNDSMSFSQGSATTSRAVKAVSDDVAGRARYGFLDISSVSDEKISFSATIFSSDGSSCRTLSYTLATGEACDLNDDDQNDLQYDLPPIKRTGYERARWLTFLCSEEEGHTAMYITFTEAEKNAGYRAAGSENQYALSAPPEGFYGVNSDGRFIFLKKMTSGTNASSVTLDSDAAFGDFIVGIDADLPSFSSDLDESQVSGTLISSENPEAEDLTVDNGCKATVNTNCYTVTGLSGTNAIEFESYSYAYSYILSQFPDKTNGPKDLLDALTADDDVKTAIEELYGSKSLPSVAENVIDLLNSVLTDEKCVKAIAYANGLKEKYDEMVQDTSYVLSGQKLARRFVDSYYSQSPKADIKSPDISNVYPFAFVSVGNAVDGDFTASNRSVYYDDYSDSSRVISSSYSDFKSKRDAINKKWNEFSSFSITKITYEGADKKQKTIFLQKDLGLTLSGGVKGGVSITSSKAQVDLGAAVYVSLDASGEQIINNVINYLTSGINLGIKDTQMQIGPVPIVYGCAVSIGFNFGTNINPHLCFVGLYGGEASFGATYGIEWKGWWIFRVPWPYFSPFGSTNKICETAAYFGFEDTTDDPYIIWGPWVKVQPSIGLGWSALSVRASAPIITSFKMKNKLLPPSIESANLDLKVGFEPYFELSVLKLINIRKSFGTYNIIDGTLQLYPPPIQWK